ncbi:MAG: tRNA (adenosine(37)-N6)-threonylcarbamoyltransferase complex dimerization subunit type 1 TsaB [Geminicoccaceae bacterium]
MLGLAIDSADRTASAALWRSSADHESSVDRGSHGRFEIVAEGALASESGRADQLITVIERLLDGQALTYGDLDVIAVNCGPGSFTGIRSAVALGRGLALAAGLPVLGVSCHETLAASLGPDEAKRPLMVAMDARRGEVYAAAFSAEGRSLSAIQARPPAVVVAELGGGSWRLAGHGAHLVMEALDGEAEVEMIEARPIDAAAVAKAAAGRLAAGETPSEGRALQPLYIRAPDAAPSAPLIPGTRPLGIST